MPPKSFSSRFIFVVVEKKGSATTFHVSQIILKYGTGRCANTPSSSFIAVALNKPSSSSPPPPLRTCLRIHGTQHASTRQRRERGVALAKTARCLCRKRGVPALPGRGVSSRDSDSQPHASPGCVGLTESRVVTHLPGPRACICVLRQFRMRSKHMEIKVFNLWVSARLITMLPPRFN